MENDNLIEDDHSSKIAKIGTFNAQIKVVSTFLIILSLVIWLFFRLEAFRNIQVDRTVDDAAQWEAIKSNLEATKVNQEAIQTLERVVQSNAESVQALTLRVDSLISVHIQNKGNGNGKEVQR